MAKRMISTIATTNSGSEVTASEITEVTWSNQPSLRNAAMAPSNTPMTRANHPGATTRTAELTRRGATCPQTA